MNSETQKIIYEIIHLKKIGKSDEEIKIILSRRNFNSFQINELIANANLIIKYGASNIQINDKSLKNKNLNPNLYEINLSNNKTQNHEMNSNTSPLKNPVNTYKNSNNNNNNNNNNNIKIKNNTKSKKKILFIISMILIVIFISVIKLNQEQDKEPNISFNIEISRNNFNSNESLDFQIKTLNVERPQSVLFIFYLINEDNTPINTWRQNEILENNRVFNFKYNFDQNINSGRYLLNTEILQNGNKIYETKTPFFSVTNHKIKNITNDNETIIDNKINTTVKNEENIKNNLIINNNSEVANDDGKSYLDNVSDETESKNININNLNNINSANDIISLKHQQEALETYEMQNDVKQKTSKAIEISISRPQEAAIICNSLPQQNFVDNCLVQVAYRSSNIEFCEIIYRNDQRDLCFLQNVIKEKNFELCERIINQRIRTQCKLLNPNS